MEVKLQTWCPVIFHVFNFSSGTRGHFSHITNLFESMCICSCSSKMSRRCPSNVLLHIMSDNFNKESLFQKSEHSFIDQWPINFKSYPWELFVRVWKDSLLAELEAKMSTGCRFLLFWHHNYQVSLIGAFSLQRGQGVFAENRIEVYGRKCGATQGGLYISITFKYTC